MSSDLILNVTLGLLMGLLGGGVHLLLLKRTLERAYGWEDAKAKRYILRGLPWRLVIWVPALLVVAQRGLAACLALVVGLVMMRGGLSLWGRGSLKAK